MTRRKLTPDERGARMAARWQIVRAANRYRTWLHAGTPYAPVLFGLRHIQQAVCIVRRRGLVKAKVLEAAGFRGQP